MLKLNIDRNDEKPDVPIAVVFPEAVPVRGSVHLAANRVMSREDANRQFMKLKFL